MKGKGPNSWWRSSIIPYSKFTIVMGSKFQSSHFSKKLHSKHRCQQSTGFLFSVAESDPYWMCLPCDFFEEYGCCEISPLGYGVRLIIQNVIVCNNGHVETHWPNYYLLNILIGLKCNFLIHRHFPKCKMETSCLPRFSIILNLCQIWLCYSRIWFLKNKKNSL